MEKQYRSVMESACKPGGASLEAIAKAEQELGVVFPTAYRDFLKENGAAMGEGYEIAGLFALNDSEAPMWKNVVAVTNQKRRITRCYLAATLLPVSDDGLGMTYYLDASDQESSPVIAYGPGVDGERVAESFEEFVVKISKGGIFR